MPENNASNRSTARMLSSSIAPMTLPILARGTVTSLSIMIWLTGWCATFADVDRY